MKYEIKKLGMQIILDALQGLYRDMKTAKEYGYSKSMFDIDDVGELLLSLESEYIKDIDNNGEYNE